MSSARSCPLVWEARRVVGGWSEGAEQPSLLSGLFSLCSVGAITGLGQGIYLEEAFKKCWLSLDS